MANGVLEILLEYAEGLTERTLLSCLSCFNAWDARNPYISIRYGNQERISNVARGEGKKFIWNEKFRFQVEYEGEENIHKYNKLVLQVMDKHNLSDNDFVGEAKTYLKDVVILGMEKGNVEVDSQKHRVVRPDNSYSGTISFSVTFKVLLEYAEGIHERSFLCCLNCFNAWDARKPFISIKYGNQQLISNVAQGVGSKFIWNENFKFQVEYEDEENIHAYDKLTLIVMDKHNLSGNDIVGEATTHVKDVVILGMETGHIQLHSQKYRLVRPDKSYSGAISFSLTFQRKDEEDLGGWKENTIDG